MISFRKNRDKLLGVAAVITFLIGSANALEYFLAGKKYLFTREGVVENVLHERYENSRGILYSKTTIRLRGIPGKFYLSDNADDGGYIEVANGDVITVYARKWYQFLYNYDGRDNLYYVEKDGRLLYNNLGQWKAAAFTYMCIYGGCSLFLLVMYLDQARNISISNWFQKRFSHKQENQQV